jgi:CRP/FNR family cyclic AMP-dependent transcriptional regulator
MPAPAPYGLAIIDSCLTCHLREDRIFCNLPPSTLKAFDSLKQLATYPKGAVLFLEGQAPRGVFVVCSGQVKLSMSSSQGRTLILKIAEAGEMVGLPATISGRAYEVTAETQSPAQVNFIRRDEFLDFLRNNADASLRVAMELSERYHSACRELRMLGLSESVLEKLAILLVDWASKGTKGDKGEVRVRIALTQDEIAQQLGTSRETVSRGLSELKQKNIISMKGSLMVIQNLPELQKLATS